MAGPPSVMGEGVCVSIYVSVVLCLCLCVSFAQFLSLKILFSYPNRSKKKALIIDDCFQHKSTSLRNFSNEVSFS